MWHLQNGSEAHLVCPCRCRIRPAMFCPKEAHDTIASIEPLTPLGRYD